MFSSLKKTIRYIHLWLGFASGLVVFIVALTGAIWVFEQELSDLFYNYRKVEIQDKPAISLSRIQEIVSPHLKKINAIYYHGPSRSIEVREWNEIDGKIINS
ncbi:MAG TPA: PepSY-associated TM helix domain-containing protein, partial [Flavobacterium sp.]|nr:PepSY-associated TM helix domain-containing protein [Flavobacterium sp.]